MSKDHCWTKETRLKMLIMHQQICWGDGRLLFWRTSHEWVTNKISPPWFTCPHLFLLVPTCFYLSLLVSTCFRVSSFLTPRLLWFQIPFLCLVERVKQPRDPAQPRFAGWARWPRKGKFLSSKADPDESAATAIERKMGWVGKKEIKFSNWSSSFLPRSAGYDAWLSLTLSMPIVD